MKKLFTLVTVALFLMSPGYAQRKKAPKTSTKPKLDATIFTGLKLRNLSPGIASGRVTDVAIHPVNKNIRYVAVASGGVWKTSNMGTTWEPIFDREGSYSIGTVVIDENNPNVVWVGTGENNAQRSVSKGDGVYRSVDGGKTWQNMGLKTSEHIGKIVIYPHNSNVVFVAAQGSVWKSGGDRGLYKTIDGGKHWERILNVSDETGISDVIVDPRNPDIIIASAYQRRRHFGMLVAGGPDGGAFRSEDGGKNWDRMGNGFPQGELGRIGLARSPQNADVLYSIVAGTETNSGIYRSSDNGMSWKLMNNYKIVDAQYYMEIFPDPHQFDRIYVIDMMTKVSEDGGKTLSPINHDRLHVDNHEVEFDRNDPNYLLVAGDGGVFESWDHGKNWKFAKNLPITQFYRVGLDNDFPFYNVYGGTQDNNTLGGPSRTTNWSGIKNSDWYITRGGDGFQTRVDPENPDIVYSMSQYAGIVRFDKKSGEKVDIQPQPGAGAPPYQWNWDAPLVISNFNNKTLYFAAERVFKSTDRGDSWQEISPNLSRQLDRNKMEVMGRVWGIDAIFKNVWTSPYGTIVAMDESPLKEGLIYVGTDDGLIQVTEDDGKSWRKIEGISGVPRLAYVADIHASPTNENIVYAVFNYHKYGDYKPYYFRSNDKGRTWKNISANLPEGDYGWTILQDHKSENLLFAGTEYGLYFSVDGGSQWIKFRSGIPTIAIRDLEIQRRENDLVAASFGRGFYILDDYSALREISPATLNYESYLFEVKDTWSYLQDNPVGWAIGADFYSSPNPAYGVVLTYYLKEGSQSLESKRKKKEQALIKAGQPVPYPEWVNYNKEKWEKRPAVVFSIVDSLDHLIARVNAPDRTGINRIAWNLRHAGTNGNNGPLATPGTYSVKMSRLVNGVWQDLGQQQSFKVKALGNTSLPAEDTDALNRFQLYVLNLDQAIRNANAILSSSIKEMAEIRDKLVDSGENTANVETAESIRQSLLNLELELNGNQYIVDKMELIPPSIRSRVRRIRGHAWTSTSAVTQTHIDSFEIASQEYAAWCSRFNAVNGQIKSLSLQISGTGILIKSGNQNLSW